MLSKKVKYYLVAIFFCISIFEISGINYYISSSNGDDLHTMVQARNSTTPWKSLNKLNSKLNIIEPGDSVLFKRGDVFYGSLYVSVVGTFNLPVSFGAYGEGENPEISGLTVIKDWKKKGTNLWEADCILGGNKLTIVLINNTLQQIGRYPNSENWNNGYLKIESHLGNSQISDKQLYSEINWTGGELVVRKNHWIIDRCQIENHTNKTITYTGGSSYEPKNGWGYFIQNHPHTLDKNGEWYFNPKTKKILMYSELSNPSLMVIHASTIERLSTVYNSNNLNFENINFNGSNYQTLFITKSKSIVFKNCSFNNSGVNAIEVNNSSLISVENSNISTTNNNAIYFAQNCSTSRIINNKISNTGATIGSGQSGDGTYTAINVEGYNIRIEGNTIENTGYIPICFRGDSTVIKNNYITNFLSVKDDGGGIYGGGSGDGCKKSINQKMSFINGNILINGIGAAEGTDNDYDCANGIYLDDNASNIEINANTVSGMKSAGIFIHNSHKLRIMNNTLFNNGKQLYVQYNDCELGKLRNIEFKNNVLCSKNDTQSLIQIFTSENDVEKFGQFDNNYYCQSSTQQNAIKVNNNEFTLKKWQTRYQKDLRTKNIHFNANGYRNSVRLEYNSTNTTKVINTNNMYNIINYKNAPITVNLKPFSSYLLIKR